MLEAIAEFDQIGEEAFLADYAFGRSYRFMVNHSDRRYNCKALLGAADRYQFPQRAPLGRGDFIGGAQTTTVLQRLVSPSYRSTRRRLVTDGYDSQVGLLIEAKASPRRQDIRMAIGELLDYDTSPPNRNSQFFSRPYPQPTSSQFLAAPPPLGHPQDR